MEQAFSHSTKQERRYLVILGAVIVLLGSVQPFLLQSSYKGSAELHAAFDVFGGLLGLISGLALVAHYSSLGNRIYLFLGLAFFTGGTVDVFVGLLSFVSVKGLTGVSKQTLERFMTTAYVAARLQMGLIVLLAPSIMERMRKRTTASKREGFGVTLLVLALGGFAAVLLFRLTSPQFANPDDMISRPVDFLLGLLFMAALTVLLVDYHRQRDMLTWWVALSIGVSTVALFMMAFSKEIYDSFFNISHAYKAMAYVVPIVGFPLCQIATAIERRQALDALQEQRSIFSTVLANTPDLIALKDMQFVYQAANAAFCDFLGKDEGEVLGRTDYHLFTQEQAESYRVSDQQVLDSGRSQLQDERVIEEEGSAKWLHLLRAPVRDGEGNVIAILSSVRDITELKRLEEKLRIMSHTDELTGLYNRRGFMVVSEQMLKNAKRNKWHAVLVFTDLDNMKEINDTHGHNEGDRALTEVADVLRATFREADIIARVGGDEFVVLALETSGREDSGLLTRLQLGLESLNAGSDRPYGISLSVGFACYDHVNPMTLDELLTQADNAMYEQKRSKRKGRHGTG